MTEDQGPKDAVRIFDTTLRDGEQAPGFSMNAAAKLDMARALAGLGVDVIEAGFAAASPGEAAAIQTIAQEIDGPAICSLARARRADIAQAAAALGDAAMPRIHVFISTSAIHRTAKLGMSKSEVLEAIKESVAFARSLVQDVEFSAEDAIRTERDFLVEALSVAKNEGASTLNVPDTVGYATPQEVYSLFAFLIGELSSRSQPIFSAHCHDDLGLALANSLAAVAAGARQVECTLHGIGERAGNCALEELVMALKTRHDRFGVTTSVDSRKLRTASDVLSAITIPPVPNKAIVGANAFSHEAGIHQHGVLKDRSTYEIMRAEDVGRSDDGIILGKHSGRAALAMRARLLDFELEGQGLDDCFEAFKEVADIVGVVDSDRLRGLLVKHAPSGARA